MTTALGLDLGREIRHERMRRGWTQVDLAGRAGLSTSVVHGIEQGAPSSLAGYVRLAVALDLEPRFSLLRERAARPVADVDPVHASLGEIEAAQFRGLGLEVLLDAPYQHYQFAGRADLVVIDRPRRAMLHIENRTRFPDIQAFAGSYNAKRAYLASDLARQLGIQGFRSVSHAVVALWSAEVLHAVRLRGASFRSICPDPPDMFAAWWAGAAIANHSSSAMVIFDPLPGERSTRRRWIGLESARTARPRYAGYAAALAALRASGYA